jgi:ribosomal protein S4
MDVQRNIKFDSRVHRLRAHPVEAVRLAAEKALKAKRIEGIDAAEAVLAAVPELREKGILDFMLLDMSFPNAAVAARHIRAGEVTINGQVAKNVRQVVHLGQQVEVRSLSGQERGKVLATAVAAAG